MLPSTKDLMYAYMKVMEFHCSSYPHFKAVEKKYKDIIKQIDFIPRTGSGKTMRYKLIQNHNEKSI